MSLGLRWNLDGIYKGVETKEFMADLEELKNSINVIDNFTQTQMNNYENVVEKLEKYITFANNLQKYNLLIYYCQLLLSVDSLDEKAQKYSEMVENIFTGMTKPYVVFQKYVGGIENLDETIERSDILKEHSFYLNEVKQKSKYSLSDKEESIIATMEITGSGAWATMKEMIFANIMEEVDINGNKKTLPLTAIRNLAYDDCAETRKNAYFAEMKAYERAEKATAAALNSIKGEVISVSKLRGYESVLDMTLMHSRMEKQTLEAMFSAMRDFLPIFRKYFRKKAEMLGHKNGLPFYDLFAPVNDEEMNFTFDEAANFVCKHFHSFSKKLGDFAKRVFESNWIDAEIREGKRGGAFCENLHAIGQSRIMVNFSGTFSDVLTLAHEIGHAYHGECLKGETPINSDYTMPIAETASTFCETLICDAALKEANEKQKLLILENDISGAAQVIVDIYSRFLFEDEVINRRPEGPLSIAELKKIMLGAQKEAYGDGLDGNFLHPYMWICKPHYYYADDNYYNFPYAYGQLFSKGLYAEFLEKGDGFAGKYDMILSSAGKNSLEDLAELAGIDVRSKEFWTSSLKIYEKMIKEFCSI